MHDKITWAALVASCLFASGCYQQIIDAVVDPSDPSAGGALAASLGGTVVATVPALAKDDPMVIGAQTPQMIVAITAGDDDAGADAHTALAVAGASITLSINSNTRSGAQISFGGSTCIANAGTIMLSSDATLHITGTFDTTGTIGNSNEPCALTGTITSVPQVL